MKSLKEKQFPAFILGVLLLFLFLSLQLYYTTQQPHLPSPIAKTINHIITAKAAGVDVTKYTQSPYNLPAPNGEPDSDFNYNEKVAANLNTLGSAVASNQSYLTSKFDAKYVDPFLSVIWIGAIENSGADAYFWNCEDSGSSINAGCPGGWYSGGWQVGYGMQVIQAIDHLEEDFNHAYGGADDASKVQQVGQQVINNSGGKITNPSTFPTKSIATLVSEAKSGNQDSRQAIAVLLLDPKIGAITIALEVAGDIAGRDDWRTTMENWPGSGASYYAPNMQNFSNRMKKIADNYTGQAGSSGGGGVGGGSYTLDLVLKPTEKDTYVLNKATAQAIGGGTASGAPSSGSFSDAAGVLGYAQQITAGLKPNLWDYYNNSTGLNICNGGYCATKNSGNSEDDLYWCTYLVIDAYNLAGHKGLSVGSHGAVVEMAKFFNAQKSNGYVYVNYTDSTGKTALPQVKPGYAFFLESVRDTYTGKEHTGLVQSIDLDSNGNGSIVTFESNSNKTSHTFTISNWQVLNTSYPVTGFGGV